MENNFEKVFQGLLVEGVLKYRRNVGTNKKMLKWEF